MPRKPRRICGASRVNELSGERFSCGGTFKPALEEQVDGKWVLASDRPVFRGAKMRYSPTKLECQHCGSVAS